jgi:hypothetical protein
MLVKYLDGVYNLSGLPGPGTEPGIFQVISQFAPDVQQLLFTKHLKNLLQTILDKCVLSNGTTRFKKCKQLSEYQHLLLFRDIWWPKVSSIFKCSTFFRHQC